MSASCRPPCYNLIGSRGGSWHLLTAGAFITMIVPLLVFLAAPAGIRARDPGRLRQVVTLARLMIAFAGTELPPSAARRISEQGVAGVTLFRVHNVVDPPQIRGLTAAIQAARPAGAPPLLVAADQEGGQLRRPGRRDDRSSRARWRSARPATKRWPSASPARRRASCVPSASTWTTRRSATWPTTRPTRRSGSAASATIPEAVGRLAAATVRGLQDDGVAATAKHFPGAGDTAADPHHELPLVRRTNAELAERELVPFRAALAAGARMVMTGHFALPGQDDDLPTSLSAAVLRDLLRGQLEFDGVTVTDALDMRALAQGSAQIVDAVAALRAGEDVLLGTADERALERLEEGLAQAQRRGLIDADDDAAAQAPAGRAASLARRATTSRRSTSSGAATIRPSPPSWPDGRSPSSATTTGCCR